MGEINHRRTELKRIATFVAAAILTGCATDLPEYTQAMQRLEDYNKVKFVALVGDADAKQLSQDKRNAVDACIKAFSSFRPGQNASKGPRFYMQHKRSVFQECTKADGVTADVGVISPNGQRVEFNDFIQEIEAATNFAVDVATRNDFHKAEQNRATNYWAITLGMAFANALSAAAGGTHYVTPHVRQNGTLVDGYLRSNPNQYCFDNIRGCQ